MSRYAFALAAAFMWGIGPVLAKQGVLGGASSMQVNLWAALLAVPPYYGLAAVLARRPWKLDARVLPLLALSGVINVLAVLGLFTAVALAPVAAVTVVVSGATPLLVFALAHVFLSRERLTWRLVLGTALVIAGIYLVVT